MPANINFIAILYDDLQQKNTTAIFSKFVLALLPYRSIKNRSTVTQPMRALDL